MRPLTRKRRQCKFFFIALFPLAPPDPSFTSATIFQNKIFIFHFAINITISNLLK
ncbi:hypothetical protein CSC12_2441 [Klebsiella michiganensis]|nr:hypothetical protein CSC12_2441 [Klebsiella michiganensis]